MMDIINVKAELFADADCLTIEQLLKKYGNVFSTTKRKQIRTIAVHYFRLNYGGTYRALSVLAEIWDKAGYNVIVYTDLSPADIDYPLPEGVERIVFPACSSVKERMEFFSESLSDHKVDVYIPCAWLSDYALWDVLAAKSAGVHVIMHTHGHFHFMYLLPDYISKNRISIYRLCDMVLVLDEDTRKFMNCLGIKSMLIHNSVPDTLISSSRSCTPPYNPHRILWIGRFAPEKHPADAIHIFEVVKKRIPDAELDFVGQGELLSHMQTLCERLRLSDSVHFHGYRQDADSFYNECSLVMMTSKYEGSPYVLLESKAHARPVVMYDIPYLETTKDGLGVRTAVFGDIEKAAEASIEILENETLRNRLSEESAQSFRKIIGEDFSVSWKKVFDETLDETQHPEITEEGHFIEEITETVYSTFSDFYNNSMELQIGRAMLGSRTVK